MAALRLNIEEQIRRNGWEKENQAGFTAGGRIENNILILRYCREISFTNKKSLIVISIDYAKAFDSVRRDMMVKVLIDYKINEKAIDVTTKLYQGDITKIKLDDGEEIAIPVTSGTRQGCTDSTTLVKLVTYKIIQKLEVMDRGFRDELFKITLLFYADDGVLLASSIEDAERVVE